MHVVSFASGPALGVILSKEDPNAAVQCAFFVPVGFFLLMYLLICWLRPEMMLTPEEHQQLRVRRKGDRQIQAVRKPKAAAQKKASNHVQTTETTKEETD